MESVFKEPPSPSEVLGAAWAKVVSEKVIGSATACIVTLDQRLNQLSYANLGDSGVIILRHMSSNVIIIIT
jgi:protein phosphatase PTC7